MSETRTYSHVDIQRYLQHKMSAGEMHALEKAMMDDPFLADAIEGFRQSDETISANHLQQIEREIKGENEKPKVVAMPHTKNVWWRVAAAVLIVFVCATTYIIFNNSSDKSNGLVTLKDNAETMSQTDSTTSANTLSLTSDSINRLRDQPLARNNKVTDDQTYNQQRNQDNNRTSNNPGMLATNESNRDVASNRNIMQAPANASELEQQESKQLTERKTSVAEAAASLPVESDMNPSKDVVASFKKSAPETTLQSESLVGRLAGVQANQTRIRGSNTVSGERVALKEFKGKVTDPAGKPVPHATVRLNTGEITTTDVNGDFNIRATDTATEVTVSSVGFANATARLNNSEAKIVLKPVNDNLSDVVVVGYGAQKKQAVTGSTSSVLNSPEPVGGWANFDAYVSKSVASYRDSTSTSPYDRDNVTLEFSIDKQGRPVDITIVRTGTRSDALNAISILKKGPLWKNEVKDARMVYTFRFK